MASINILPEILSNQIAAGEIVERPASVVKEFLENSIDAKSSRIRVEIEQGGRSLIRVADNGSGMSYEDALLAVERYATSKIASQSDLAEIRSLGFRGEALPSIAAVSKFHMVTRNKESDAATQITVEGGKLKDVTQTGAPVGTMVSAHQLFYNTPARRKFLKTVNTEMGHISETMTCIALSRPGIAFRLDHNQKTIKDWPGANDPFDRIADVLGRELENLLYPVKFSNNAAGVSGWVADPSVTRSGASRIYVFINGRFVRNRAIIYALCEGFRGRLMKGRFPVAAVFIDVPASEVDVNVHPAKQEVRFLKHRQVIEAVRTAVEKAWSSAKADAFKKSASPRVRPPWEYEDFTLQNESDQGEISQSRTEYQTSRQQAEPPVRAQAELFEQGGFFTNSFIIGQFQNTYIICDKSGELVMIDQHAAHERILYERLRGTRTEAKAEPLQRLLVPETVELGHKQAPAMERLLPELNVMGFEIEHFGGETFVIKAVPSVLAETQIASLITDIAETAENTGTGPGIEDLLNQCITAMACHGAIRASQALSRQEMTDLLKQLDECENPFNCPHGRPTLIRWPLEFLEKSFKRIV
ncbi:MAG: DNA mismatch repair endonuclease MutL [Desulfosalsimonas sp.]